MLALGAVTAKDAGFTLIELLVAMAIIGTLAAIAIPAYNGYRTQAWDTAAKSDLRNAMTAVEAVVTATGMLPGSAAVLAQYGHRLSSGVSFVRFQVRTTNGVRSVHMHTKHTSSKNAWHADYPAEGARVQIR